MDNVLQKQDHATKLKSGPGGSLNSLDMYYILLHLLLPFLLHENNVCFLRILVPVISIQKKNNYFTIQVSSMIHSERPTVTPVANIVFCCFVFLDLKSGDGRMDVRTNGRTDGQHVRKCIPTGSDFGLAEWIN